MVFFIVMFSSLSVPCIQCIPPVFFVDRYPFVCWGNLALSIYEGMVFRAVIRNCHWGCTKVRQGSGGHFKLPASSGPEVIKLSRARTRTPNRTPCSKSYSYSRSRGYKTFSYSYSYSSGVQISDFSSKLHSLLRTILKAVFVRNIISDEIYQAEFNKRFQFFICESKYYLFIHFCFLWRIRGGGEMYTYKHVYINYINSTRTCTLVPNTQI